MHHSSAQPSTLQSNGRVIELAGTLVFLFNFKKLGKVLEQQSTQSKIHLINRKEEPSQKSSCQQVKINPNFKIVLSH